MHQSEAQGNEAHTFGIV